MWADDPVRRALVGIPDEVEFEKKPDIALQQVAAALKEGLRPEVVLADAGYGKGTEFREKLTEMGLHGELARGNARPHEGAIRHFAIAGGPPG